VQRSEAKNLPPTPKMGEKSMTGKNYPFWVMDGIRALLTFVSEIVCTFVLIL
jgi:hypothetical protein